MQSQLIFGDQLNFQLIPIVINKIDIVIVQEKGLFPSVDHGSGVLRVILELTFLEEPRGG